MRPQVLHVIHNPELLKAFTTLILWPGVIYLIHTTKLFITSRALSSQP